MKHRALAVLFEFACRGTAALVLAAPLTAAVAATGLGAFPQGDRLLFEPGGLFLVEVARATAPWLSPLANASLVTLTLLGIALTLPAALLWTASTDDAPMAVSALFGRAVALVPSLLALAGFAFLGQVLAVCLGLAGAGFFHGAVENPEEGDLWALLPLAAAGLVVLAFGLLRDTASAAVTCGAPNARAALRVALATLVLAPGKLLARWLTPAVAGLALVALVAAAVGAVDVGRPGAGRVLLVTSLHQGVVLALSIARAVWFAGATRVVKGQLDAGSDARR